MQRMQCARQLAYLCGASGALGNSSSVEVNAVGVEALLSRGLTFPIASVQLLSSEPDPDFPARLREARFRVSIAGTAGTESTRMPRLGSAGTQVSGKDASEAVRDLVDYLNDGALADSTHAMQGHVEDISPPRLVVGGPDKQHSVVDVDFVVYNATQLSRYHAPVRFVNSGSLVGQATFSWTLPPARFDRLSVILRKASGSTAPSSATSGTGVTLSGATATTVTDTVAAGTWSYALFESYDDTNATPTTATHYSSQTSLTKITVTVT